MYTIISPAKTFERKASRLGTSPTPRPAELEHYAHPITETALSMSIEELSKALRLSHKLALEARQDWLSFVQADTAPHRALELYSGMVFKKVNARDFSPKQWREADERLGICSFVYGLLRPSEGIRPYRMEGDVRLGDGSSVFGYWRDILTPLIIERTSRAGGVLLFLASEEMKQLFHWEEVERSVQVITPTFLTSTESGKLKQIVIYTKMARGEMAGAIVRQCIDRAEVLQGLSPSGFVYRPDLSSHQEWVYVLG